jgi:transposase
MTQQDSGRDRLGRRAKRFLSPSQKYELWLQLLTGELSQSEAAERFGIDRSTVMRIRQVAKQGALEALAASKPGVRQAREDAELPAARAAGRDGQGAGDRADLAAGKIALEVLLTQ